MTKGWIFTAEVKWPGYLNKNLLSGIIFRGWEKCLIVTGRLKDMILHVCTCLTNDATCVVSPESVGDVLLRYFLVQVTSTFSDTDTPVLYFFNRLFDDNFFFFYGKVSGICLSVNFFFADNFFSLDGSKFHSASGLQCLWRYQLRRWCQDQRFEIKENVENDFL